jgi:hypothetical protein
MGADDADDGKPAFSGAELAVLVMRMIRVLARPSFVKPISTPTLRKKGALGAACPTTLVHHRARSLI